MMMICSRDLTALAEAAAAVIIILPGYADQMPFNSRRTVIELQTDMLLVSFNQSRRVDMLA